MLYEDLNKGTEQIIAHVVKASDYVKEKSTHHQRTTTSQVRHVSVYDHDIKPCLHLKPMNLTY